MVAADPPRNRDHCQKAAKNLKTIQKQSEYEKLPAAETHNDELAIDFAGPFKLAPKAKKYLLVSIDHKTNWPNASFVKKPTAETVINFLNAHTIVILLMEMSKQLLRQSSKYIDSNKSLIA